MFIPKFVPTMARRFDGFWLRSPFTSCIIGPSKSGKTVLLDKLIAGWDWVGCGAKIGRLVLLYDCWQPIYDDMLARVPPEVEIVVRRGFPVEEARADKLFKKSTRTTLVVIDDLSTEMESNKEIRQAVSRLFRVLSHHRYEQSVRPTFRRRRTAFFLETLAVFSFYKKYRPTKR